MKIRIRQMILCCLFGVSLCAVAACGGDGGSSGDGSGNNNNGGTNNAGAQCETSEECTSGLECIEGTCRETECDNNDDCAEAEVCSQGACVEPECETAQDCDGENMICEENVCVETSTGECESADDCDGDQVCNEGTCEAPAGPECEADGDCESNEVCEQQSCVPKPEAQCARIGDACDPDADAPIGEDFRCTDIGAGNKCYDKCNPNDANCRSGSFCTTPEEGDGAFCRPSQCDGLLDNSSCDEIVENNSDQFPNGAKCVPIQEGVNACVPAGSKSEGDTCNSDNAGLECGKNLLCLDGTCTAYCGSDGMCSDGEQCLGEQSGDILQRGTGVCRQGVCSPFQHGNSDCPEGQSCSAVTENEGLCEESGDIGFYEPCDYKTCQASSDCPEGVSCSIPEGSSQGLCDFEAQCAGGASCISLGGEQGRCLPRCNPTASNPNSTCPADKSAVCQSLASRENTSATTGVCLELCEGTQSYGKQTCTSSDEGDVCSLIATQGTDASGNQVRNFHHACLPSAGNKQGESCDTDSGLSQCEAGATCFERGDGSGVCISSCVPSGADNPALTCPDEQVCQSFNLDGGDFGQCRYSCQPESFPDNPTADACPDLLKNCLPSEVDDQGQIEQAYCSASNDKASGETCGESNPAGGSSIQQNCQAGLICSVDDGLSPTTHGQQGNTPKCRQICDPFKPASASSDCPDGKACSPIAGSAGVCISKDTETEGAAFGSCSQTGKMCGNSSICVDFSDVDPSLGNLCYSLCEFNTGHGCREGESCVEPDGGLISGQWGLCQGEQ